VQVQSRAMRSRRAIGSLWAAAALAAGGVVPAGHASAAQPAEAGGSQPNIVLILTDDQTMESVAKMPYVSSRTNWINFTSAWINNALCCPSRATILQGRYDTHTGVGNNVSAGNFNESETLPVWLQRAGYRTGLFGKYFNGYPFGRGNYYVPPGWDEWQAGYGNMYKQYDWNMSSNGTSVHYGTSAADYEVNVLAQKTSDFIAASAASGQPFFAYFTPTATHSPWRASPTWSGKFATTPVKGSPNFNEADVSDKPAWVRALPTRDRSVMDANRRKEWAAAGSVDDAVRRIDGALQTAGVIDNTVVIFMTDNGYAFGEHRWVKKICEYNECNSTPLLVRYPGQGGRQDSHLISNVDLASTISEIGGATPGLPQDGMSFAPLLTGTPPASWRDGLLQHWSGGDGKGKPGTPDSVPQFWAVRTANWKYVEIDNGDKELYDEGADPYELTNRAGDATLAAVQADLKLKLDALKASAGAKAGPLRTDIPAPGPMSFTDLD